MPLLDARILRAPVIDGDTATWPGAAVVRGAVGADPPSIDEGSADGNATHAVGPAAAPGDARDSSTPAPLGVTATARVVANTAVALDEIEMELAAARGGAAVENTILRARCDDVARRVVREGGHITMAALAREIGTTPPTLKRLMATTIYRDTYHRVSDELLGTIDERIRDERLDVASRADSMQARAQTVLAECFEIVRKHREAVENGATPRPQLLKVGVDAAAEVRQIAMAERARGAGAGTTAITNITITRNQATIIQGAIRESGVDLSDVLGEAFARPASRDGEAP